MKHSFDYTDTRDKDDYKFYSVEAEYSFVTDGSYGADADGNRGISATFLDDYEFKVFDEDGEDVTNDLETNDKELFEAINKETEEQGIDLDTSSEDDCYDDCECGD